jgi:hypothetical protein
MLNEPKLIPTSLAAERLGDEIAELSAHIEVAMARLLDKISEFDALGGWAHAGAKSCAEWLAWRVGLHLRAAYERVRVARALPNLPLISAAFASRRDLLLQGPGPDPRGHSRDRRAPPDDRRNGTATHVEKVTRAWRRVDRNAENREAEQQHRCRSLAVYQDEDGMFIIHGRLTPEVGAVVRQRSGRRPTGCTPSAARKAPGEYSPTAGQVQADALGIIAEAALHHDPRPGLIGRPLPGDRPRRRRGAGRSGSAGAVGPGGGPLFRGTLAAHCVRRQSRAHDARR